MSLLRWRTRAACAAIAVAAIAGATLAPATAIAQASAITLATSSTSSTVEAGGDPTPSLGTSPTSTSDPAVPNDGASAAESSDPAPGTPAGSDPAPATPSEPSDPAPGTPTEPSDSSPTPADPDPGDPADPSVPAPGPAEPASTPTPSDSTPTPSDPTPTPTPAPAPTPPPTEPTPTPADPADPALPAVEPTPLPASAWVAESSPAAGAVVLQSDPAGIDFAVDIAWAPTAEQAERVLSYRVELFSGRNPNNANSLIARTEVDADITRYRVEAVGFSDITVTARVTAFDGAEALPDALVSAPLTLSASSAGALSANSAGAPTLSDPTADGFTVTWQAPATDAEHPAPAGYAIRVLERRHDLIATSANSWAVATYDVGGRPTPAAATTATATLTGLEGASRYLAAVVAYDVVDGVKRFRASSPMSTAPPAWSDTYDAQTLGSRAPLTEFSNIPAAPKATSARVLEFTGIATTGRYTGGSPITAYRIELFRAGTGLVASTETPATSTTTTGTGLVASTEAPATATTDLTQTPPTATFTALHPGARYSVRVAAINANGIGEFSDFSTAVTTPNGSTPGSRPPAYTDRAALEKAVEAGTLAESTTPATAEQGSDATITIPWNTPQSGETWWYGAAQFAQTVESGASGTTPDQPSTTITLSTAGLDLGTNWLLFITNDELDGERAPTGGEATAVRVTIVPSTTRSLKLDDAVLRWGLNDESNNGAYFGGCNYLSAGLTPDPGGSALFTPAQYAPRSGNVTIEKPDASGRYVTAGWDTKCLDRTGAPLSSGTSTPYGGNQFVMTGGTGEVDRATGSATVRWNGDVTVVYYGGLTFWYLSDPVLTIENGTGTLTATGSGFGTDMDDQTKWQPIAARTITLATFDGVQVGTDGFTVTPDYRGVAVNLDAGQTAQSRSGADWGSFPQSFIDFQVETGQAAYWYSSGGQADAAKPATPFVVGYDAATFAPPAAPAVTVEQAGARVPSVKLPPAKLPSLAPVGTASVRALDASTTASAVVILDASGGQGGLTRGELVLLVALIAALGLVIVVVGAGGGAVVLGMTTRK